MPEQKEGEEPITLRKVKKETPEQFTATETFVCLSDAQVIIIPKDDETLPEMSAFETLEPQAEAIELEKFKPTKSDEEDWKEEGVKVIKK